MRELFTYTVYHSPLDYPGKWVIRRFRIMPAEAVPDALVAVEDSYDQAVAQLPSDAIVAIRRDSSDPLSIVETWF